MPTGKAWNMIVQINKDSNGKEVSVHLIAEGDQDRRSLAVLADAMQKQNQPRLYLDSHVITLKGVENILLATGK